MIEEKTKKDKKKKENDDSIDAPILREVVVFDEENIELIQDTPSQKLI